MRFIVYSAMFLAFVIMINCASAGVINKNSDRASLIREYLGKGENVNYDDSENPIISRISNELYSVNYRYGDLAPRFEIIEKNGNSYNVIDVTSDDNSLCSVGNSGSVNGIGNVIIINCTVGNIEEWSRILIYDKSSGIKELVAYADAAQINNGILEVLMRDEKSNSLGKYKNIKIYKK